MSDGFDFSDLISLVDTVTSYKSKQDAINLARRKQELDNETLIDLEEKKLDLIQDNKVSENSLSIQKSTYENQLATIKNLQKQLQDWDLTYQDHIDLPNDFKSPDGMSVIDEHTGQFKGKIIENVKTGYDTLSQISNFENTIDYNNQVIDGLENLRSKYIRGQEFASKIGSELMIDGIKDKADLGYSVQQAQREFSAELDMITFDEESWNAKYPTLVDEGIMSYDPDMDADKHNARWNNWKFITGQKVHVDDNGVPFVVAEGPEASDWINSPEWKGLMDQLSLETAGQVSGGSTWDANVSQFLQDKIDKNISRLGTLSTKNKSYQELNKLIGGIDQFTIDSMGDYLDNAAAGLDSYVGTDKEKNIDSEIYAGISSASNIIKEMVTDKEFNYQINEDIYNYLTPIIVDVVNQGINADVTPAIINDMVAKNDAESLVSLFLHGVLPEMVRGKFSENGLDSNAGTFNQYETTHSSVDRVSTNLNNAGGLFSAQPGGSNMRAYADGVDFAAYPWMLEEVNKLKKAHLSVDDEGNEKQGAYLDTDKWMLGFENVTYKGNSYKVGGARFPGFGDDALAEHDEGGWDILDYQWSKGGDNKNLQAVKELFQLYEVVNNIRTNKRINEGGMKYNPFIDFSPMLTKDSTGVRGKGIYPQYLAPQAGMFASQLDAAEAGQGVNYNPQDIQNIEQTLMKLEEYKKYYK